MIDDPQPTPEIPEAVTPEPDASEAVISTPPPESENLQIYDWPTPQEPLAQMQVPEPVAIPPRPPKIIPNIGHFFVFLALIIPAVIVGYVVALVCFRVALPHLEFRLLLDRMTHNVLYAIAMQAAMYGVLWGLTVLVFGLWWGDFAKGIHWNGAVAKRWALALAGAGVATGLLVTLAGNFVPMPKAPPILDDLTKSRLGAWFLMSFGVTLAPLTEELAFRGFLLPSLINIFGWLERKQSISEAAVRTMGIPLSILLTSIPFAFMHAQQVSFSWGPVLLIGLVSVVLCVVRLRSDSLACSIIVHSFYNLTLFTGLLIQTDGFRHLEKLKG